MVRPIYLNVEWVFADQITCEISRVIATLRELISNSFIANSKISYQDASDVIWQISWAQIRIFRLSCHFVMAPTRQPSVDGHLRREMKKQDARDRENNSSTPGDIKPWCHDMETLSALLALCEVNPPVTDGSITMRTFDVFLVNLCQQAFEQTDEWSFIWDAVWLMWRHCYGRLKLACCSLCIDPSRTSDHRHNDWYDMIGS